MGVRRRCSHLTRIIIAARHDGAPPASLDAADGSPAALGVAASRPRKAVMRVEPISRSRPRRLTARAPGLVDFRRASPSGPTPNPAARAESTRY